MRIVNTDNFGEDYPDERFILFVMSKQHAQGIADILNEALGPDATRYYKVVDNDYELLPGFEP